MPLTYLQIGSWNIEHLSKVGGRKESPYALTDHIEMAGIQILALQEIYDTSPPGGERRNRELTTVCKLLEEHSPGEVWKYELFPNRDPDDQSQLCGVLWNDSVVRKSEPYQVAVEHRVGADKLWDRAPHAVRFSAPYGDDTKSVIVVPLHMKSNYGGSSEGRRIRHLEAKQLASQLDAIREHFDDPSLILIGDTNVLDVHEKAIEVYEQGGLIDLNARDTATYPGYGGSPFDRAFVATGRQEFKYTRQYVLQSADMGLHDKFLSDHYMIKITVKLYVDDSDPRE